MPCQANPDQTIEAYVSIYQAQRSSLRQAKRINYQVTINICVHLVRAELFRVVMSQTVALQWCLRCFSKPSRVHA